MASADGRGDPQRERLLDAMLKVVAEKGYEHASIADVVDEAGVSRTDFYEVFASKRECMLASYDALIDDLVARVLSAYDIEGSWPDKVRAGLDALLRWLGAEPELARMATVEIPAAGRDAHDRYRRAIHRFVEIFLQGRGESDAGRELPADTEVMALGGAEAIIFEEVVAGRTEGLPRLLPDILFALLVPYLGPARAASEMRRASDLA